MMQMSLVVIESAILIDLLRALNAIARNTAKSAPFKIRHGETLTLNIQKSKLRNDWSATRRYMLRGMRITKIACR
jgi:hypothetical protein